MYYVCILQYVYQMLIDICKIHVNVLFQPNRMNLLYQKSVLKHRMIYPFGKSQKLTM